MTHEEETILLEAVDVLQDRCRGLVEVTNSLDARIAFLEYNEDEDPDDDYDETDDDFFNEEERQYRELDEEEDLWAEEQARETDEILSEEDHYLELGGEA
jgi:hypothetical protein